MRTRVLERSFYILLLVAVLTLLVALPILAAAPSAQEVGRTLDGGTCPRRLGRSGAYDNCPGSGGELWRW